MIPELGHFALALALALALAQGTLPILGAGFRDSRLMAAGLPLAYGQLLAVLAGFGALMWSFVVSDTTVSNVVANSHSAKPLLYKLTGTWGNHEGSMVLWVLILALCGGAVAGFGRNLPTALQARVIGVPRGRSGARTEPVISTVPLGRRSAICAIASASRVRKNGKADSGQIRMVASLTPVDCGPEARSDSERYFFITSALAA